MNELAGRVFYFQFTLTGYGPEVEPGIPDKKSRMLPIFQELSRRIGKERVLWRYDPVFLNGRCTEDCHLRAFGQIVRVLQGFTERVTVSFLDVYPHLNGWLRAQQVILPEVQQRRRLAAGFAHIAAGCGSFKLFLTNRDPFF